MPRSVRHGWAGARAGAGEEARITVSQPPNIQLRDHHAGPVHILTLRRDHRQRIPRKTSRSLACNYGPICHNTPSGDVTIPPPPNPKSRTEGHCSEKKLRVRTLFFRLYRITAIESIAFYRHFALKVVQNRQKRPSPYIRRLPHPSAACDIRGLPLNPEQNNAQPADYATTISLKSAMPEMLSSTERISPRRAARSTGSGAMTMTFSKNASTVGASVAINSSAAL